MPRTLLIVDDAAIIRRMISDVVADSGWRIAGEACNGQQAVERYEELRPDVVTLDMVMPEYDGMYALREIMEINPAAKVVVVSALEQKRTLIDAFRTGAADFVVKPFDKKNLLATLEASAPKAACPTT